MKLFIAMMLTLFFTAAYAQDLTKDTIQLNNVSINKSLKRPKLKSFYFGSKDMHFLNNIFFDDIPDYYLVDNIPYGVVQQLTFFLEQEQNHMKCTRMVQIVLIKHLKLILN